MAVPTRATAVSTLEEGHTAVRALLDGLSEDDLTRAGTIGGGTWSAKDLIGHLTSWEEIALDSLAEWRRGARPGIEDVFASDRVDRLNEENVTRKASFPLEEVRASAEAVHRALIAAIQGATDGEWTAKAPYETERRRTLATLLGSVLGAPKRPFGHAFAHLPDLEAYVDSFRTNA